MLLYYLLYRFSACSVLLLLLSFNIIFTIFCKSSQLWKPLFLLIHSHLITQLFLSHLKQLIPFLKSMLSLSISCQTWLTLGVAILCRARFLDSSLITAELAHPNQGTPSWQDTFNIHSSLIHAVIRYVCIGHLPMRHNYIPPDANPIF